MAIRQSHSRSALANGGVASRMSARAIRISFIDERLIAVSSRPMSSSAGRRPGHALTDCRRGRGTPKGRPGRRVFRSQVAATMRRRNNRGPVRTGLWLSCVTLTFAVAPALAFACPNCDSARLVQAAVWGRTALQNVVNIALPFAVLGALAALVHRIGSPRSPRRETRQ